MPRRPVIVVVMTTAIVLTLVAGCSPLSRDRGMYMPVMTGEAPSGQARAVLWFDGPGGEPVPVTRVLSERRAGVWAAIDALAAGPQPESGLAPALPSGSKLRKVTFWEGDLLPAGTVDLDFGGLPRQVDRTARDAILRSLAQFVDIRTARILNAGVPVTWPGADATAEPALLNLAEVRTPARFVPVQAGSRLYLAAHQLSGNTTLTDFDALASLLIDAPYIESLLPRGSKVTWVAAPAMNGRSVAFTIELRHKKPTERDWQLIQVAADAVALTLRSIPGTAMITVTVAGQDRSYSYSGPIWPNPEPE